MTNKTKQHLDTAIATSQFRFGDYISRGFELWKEQAGLYIAFGILMMVATGVIGLIPIVGPVVNQIIVSPLLVAGAYIFTHKLANKERPEFGAFFDVTEYAVKIISLYAIYVVIMVALIAPLFLMMDINMDVLSGDEEAVLEMIENISPLILLAVIPFIIIGFAIAYAPQFIIFYKLSLVDSVKFSAKLFFKHPIMLFFYFIVVGLIAISGIIGLCVGLFITYSMLFPMAYTPFRHITQLAQYESGDSDNDIYDSLVEVI